MTKRNGHFVLPTDQRLGFLSLYAHIDMLLSQEHSGNHRPLLIFCIGSEVCTGDLLGPLVGMELVDTPNFSVHGDLSRQIHAGNFEREIGFVQKNYENSVVIAVDACLGDAAEIGNIEVWKGGLQAGLAAGNSLPEFGDISIVGIVNSAAQPALYALQSTPLVRIVKMAKCIGSALNLLSCQMSAVSLGGRLNVSR